MAYKHPLASNIALSRAQKVVVLQRSINKGQSPSATPNSQMGGPVQDLASPQQPPQMPQMTEATGNPQGPYKSPVDAGVELQDPKEVSSEVGERIQRALIADQIWKDGGGNNSVGAKIWEQYKKESKTAHLDTPRDYFVSSYIKWKDDPEKFKKKHPREADLLKRLDEASMSDQQALQQPLQQQGV